VSHGSLQLTAAKVALGQASPNDLAAAAEAALADGVDSSALRVLAGLAGADLDEARLWFDRAAAELGIRVPSPHDSVLSLAREAAAEIIRGVVAPYPGAKYIWTLVRRVPTEHISELDPFIYAASEWEDRPDDRAFFDEGIVREAQTLLDGR
jgi:hypothetical protein